MKNQENLVHKFDLEKRFIDKLLSHEVKSILVLGASDTGKTTFIEAIGNIFIGAGLSTHIIDADVGQSHIGAPSTISSGILGREFRNWKDIELKDMCFTGSLSPAGNLKCVLNSFKRVYDACANQSDKLIIDTTGYIFSDEAVSLKIKKAEISRPDAIIAIQEINELDGILSKLTGFDIHNIKIHEGASKRTYAQRAAYRQARFKYYFSNIINWKIDARSVRMSLIGDDSLNTQLPQEAIFECINQNRLISFRREMDGFDIGLGIIKGLDRANNYIEVISPRIIKSQANFVIVGKLKDKGDFVIEDAKN